MQQTTAMNRPELIQVADTVARDKSIDREEVFVIMEQAIQKAGRSKYGQEKDIRAVINRKTGEKSNCDENARWVNEFVIPAASLAIQAKDGTTEYVIKPLEIEQTMKKASSASTCTSSGLSLGTVSLPDSSGWVDPDIGDKPTVTGPPSVVAGDKTTE